MHELYQSHACDIQRYGGHVPRQLKSMARSRHKKHRARDYRRIFMSDLRRAEVIPEYYEFQVRAYRPDRNGCCKQTIHMLLPHEWMGMLYRKRRDLFHKYFLGDPGDFTEYWLHEVHAEWVKEHPYLQDMLPGGPENMHAIGLNLHGDEARYVAKSKILIVSITGALCRAFGFLGRLVVAVIPEFMMIPNVTLPAVYARIRWSFVQLGKGIWPKHDFDEVTPLSTKTLRGKLAGEPLMGGYIGILDGTSADLEFYAKTFEGDNYMHNEMCHLCGASKVVPDLFFTQTGPGAGWQRTRVTNREWHRRMEQRGSIPELALIPGIHLHRLFLCDLHTTNLGTAGHWAGNAIWELINKDKLWAVGAFSRRELQLQRAFQYYRAWASARQISSRMSKWTVGTFNMAKAMKYPFLKAKGIETKYVATWAAGLVMKFRDGSSHDDLRAAAGWGLMEYYTAVDSSGRYLEPHMLAMLQRGVAVFLQSYHALASEAVAAEKRAWRFVPKHHMHEHISDTVAPQVNPSRVSTLGGEDLVGRIGKLASRCHKRDVIHSTLDHYCVLLGFEWGLLSI